MRDTLKQFWGYNSFRSIQEQIITEVYNSRDTLALMPTGGGKSITYQVPTMMRDGLCIVVTPLIALMKDQVDHLRQRGINAVAIHSGLTNRQIDIALDNCVYGDVKFLYVAPERLVTDTFRYRVQKMNCSLLAIDEAHCISQWGYDFRPSYLRIAELRERLPDVPVLALTASATPQVAEDIMEKLHFAKPNLIRSSFARANLSYAVRHDDDKNGQLLRIIQRVEGCGIVYARTREGCEQLSDFLGNAGITATYYHGGLPNAERAIRQEEWMSGRKRIIVATNAFGMGIDKADVRFVVHYSMPDSLEAYYQEAGRAGRDGRRAYAVLLVATGDESRVRKRFALQYPPLDEVRDIYEKICSYFQVGIGDGAQASFIFNIYDFCSKFHLFQGKVTAVLHLLQQNGYMTLTEELKNPARILFCISRDDLYKLRVVHNDLDYFLRTLLRMYDGVFTDFRAIDELAICSATGYRMEKVHDLFKRLWQMHVIRYIPSNQSPLIFFDCERLPTKDLYIAPETYRYRLAQTEERFAQMVAYESNRTECRSVMLERYFGVTDAVACGVCDCCIERRKQQRQGTPTSDLPTQILNLLQSEPRSIKELVASLREDDKRVLRCVEQLQEDGKISVDKRGKLIINR